MPRGIRVMSNAERDLRKSVREFLKKNGRTYAQAQDVKEKIEEVLVEARQAAIAAYSPPQDTSDEEEQVDPGFDPRHRR